MLLLTIWIVSVRSLSLPSALPPGPEREHRPPLFSLTQPNLPPPLYRTDPTVSLVSHLQNVSSSILLPGFMSSRAVLQIPHLPTVPSETSLSLGEDGEGGLKLLPSSSERGRLTEGGEDALSPRQTGSRRASITSHLPTRRSSISTATTTGGQGRHRSNTTTSRRTTTSYVKIKHDDPLDKHVVDVLTKRQKVKRLAKGLGEFLMTPLGVFFFFYGVSLFSLSLSLCCGSSTWDPGGNAELTILSGLRWIAGIAVVFWCALPLSLPPLSFF